MQKLRITPTIHSEKVRSVNLGADANSKYGHEEIGKPVKLIATDTYGLTSDGDCIEGIITSSEYATNGGTAEGRSVGGVVSSGYFEFVVTGAPVAVKDFVVAAANPARGTALADNRFFNAKKAADYAAVAEHPYKSRVVSLGKAGTGAVGTVCVAEFL